MMPVLRLAWQVPLAIGSYLFFKAARFCLRRMASLHYAVLSRQAKNWRIFSEEFLDEWLVLPVVMVEGPRWNTHALIARAGPLKVERTIAIHLPTAFRAANAWTMVVYRFPSHRTVASFASCDTYSEEQWSSLTLEPGRYALVLRYYGWSNNATLPEVRVDRAQAVASTPVPPDANDFYHRLAQRQSLFFRLLHYYVYVLLQYKDFLPRHFVEREFLPVGNPKTQFAYGIVPRGKRLTVMLDASLLAVCDVYLTLYDRASLPVQWNQLTEPEHATRPLGQDCMFLIRVHPKTSTKDAVLENGVTVQVTS